MKKSDLKELIREEIKKVLSENIEDVKDIFPTEPGKYQVDYIVADEDGGPDFPESDVVNISQNDIEMDQNTPPRRFWETKPMSNFKIYKVTKVTKIG